MKRLLAAFLLGLAAFSVGSETYIKPSQIYPNALAGSAARKSPCQSGAGDNCGSEPPTWHITPDQCGLVFSTSSARNESFSRAINGTGTQTVFPFEFPFLNTTHIKVVVGGVTKTEGVDYTVSAPGATGTVTFVTAPPAGSANVVISLINTFNGDGATVTFPFNFRIDYIESLEVKVGGVLKTYSTDYTITGLNSPTGGTVTFVAAPAVGTDNVSIKMVSLSTKGVRLSLPLNTEFVAAGYQSGGASAANGGQLNREGACRVGFVVAAPAPENWLRIALRGGVLGNDKLTNIWSGGASIDWYDGEIAWPEGWGTIWYSWNGTSWLYDGASANQGERVGMGQTAAHGQGRLVVATADPFPGWSVGSMVGKLAFCPNNGRGLNRSSNDHNTLSMQPRYCSWFVGSGSSTDYAVVGEASGSFATAVTQGAAYVAGTSPDGTPYPAGNYIVIVMSAAVNTIATGNTMYVGSLPMTLGSQTAGKWIVKRLTPGVDPGCAGGSPACLELHEEVQDWNQKLIYGIGPPSRFLAGDTRTGSGTVACCMSHILTTQSLASGRKTDPVMGIELTRPTTGDQNTIVGVVASVAGVYTDSTTTRNVAGYFNPVEKALFFSPSADKNIVSTTDVEVDNTTRGTFTFIDGVSTVLRDVGDAGRRVRWEVSATVSNNTAGGGCQLNVNFDGGANEVAAPPTFVNPAGVTGGKFNITFSGNKSGLSDGQHTIRLMAKETGAAGTCTIYKDNTRVTAWIPQ